MSLNGLGDAVELASCATVRCASPVPPTPRHRCESLEVIIVLSFFVEKKRTFRESLCFLPHSGASPSEARRARATLRATVAPEELIRSKGDSAYSRETLAFHT